MPMDFFDHIVPDLEDVIRPSSSATSNSGVSNSAVRVSAVDDLETESFGAVQLFDASDDIPVDNSSYDRALIEAHLSNTQAALPKLRWEEGFLGDIFGDNPTGVPNIVNVSLQPPDSAEATSSTDVAVPSVETLKRKADGAHFSSAIKVISDTDFLEQQKQFCRMLYASGNQFFALYNMRGL